ncbi:hypothetical protein [uncultured Sphingomonas sp.]|nr:hypothetical protein [uncultured Sphingomonas sp.]
MQAAIDRTIRSCSRQRPSSPRTAASTDDSARTPGSARSSAAALPLK